MGPILTRPELPGTGTPVFSVPRAYDLPSHHRLYLVTSGHRTGCPDGGRTVPVMSPLTSFAERGFVPLVSCRSGLP
jgi:hypothetical protein